LISPVVLGVCIMTVVYMCSYTNSCCWSDRHET